MTGIRELVREDIEQVADLHREVMGTGSALTPTLLDHYRTWLTDVFLDNPMRIAGIESLVFEDHGAIVGFMGVVARQVSVGQQLFRGSVGSNFCVRADRRGRIGLHMAREYVRRSSEFAFIDELSDRTRGIWDRLGFVQAPQSVRWTLPLRPAAQVLSLTGPHLPSWFAALARPPAALSDALSPRIPRSPFRYTISELAEEELTDDGLARLVSEFGSEDYLRPVVTDGSVAWLTQRARSLRRHGDLQMRALRTPEGQVTGWYVYYARQGPADVLQLVATSATASQVLSHLALHARARGVVSLTGTLDPIFLSALSEHWAALSPAPMISRWRLVYSRHPQILEAFWRDRVLLSRLDGEWCQQFP